MKNINNFDDEKTEFSKQDVPSDKKYDNVFVEFDDSEFDCDFVEGQIVEVQEECVGEAIELDSELDVDIIEIDLNDLSTTSEELEQSNAGDIYTVNKHIEHDLSSSEEVMLQDEDDTEIDEDIESQLSGSTVKDSYSSDTDSIEKDESWLTGQWSEDALSKVILLLFVAFGLLFVLYVLKLVF